MDGRWRIHPATCGERPGNRSGITVDGNYLVPVPARNEHLAFGNRRTAQSSADMPLPSRLQEGTDSRRRAAAPLGIVTIGRPLLIANCKLPNRAIFGVRGASLERAFVELALRRACGRFGREGIEASQLRRDVASAGMRRCVQQTVARHDTVFADASHPAMPEDIT